jgi:hypothetical protein
MELDFSEQWHIIGPRGPEPEGPAAFAAAELAAVMGRMGCAAPAPGRESMGERIIVLDAGRRGDRFRWRAAEDRIEVYGDDGASLLRGVYDFLNALGARWRGPGASGERLPAGPVLALEGRSRASSDDALPTTLVLAHGVFLERYAEYLTWAARVGYRSVFILTTSEPLAMEAAPEALYESLRGEIAALARRLGLSLELGGYRSDRDLDPDAFAEKAAAHPEISVFHAWPLASARTPPAQALEIGRALASALSEVRPDAALSVLLSDGAESLAEAIGGVLPPKLELLWAPRRRSWGARIDDPLRAAFRAWRSGGGGRVAVLEPYEDAFLFKGAVPPLASVIEGDLAAYRGLGVDAIGILCAGGRLPLSPRPNLALLPLLAASPATGDPHTLAEAALADWAGSAPMLDYWRELEAAWAIHLSVEEDESDAELLAAKRSRCEELFDRLRRAEALLAEAGNPGDAAEYAISGSILELNCARLSALHELAAGDPRAAADIANLALSASGAARRSFKRLEDPRSRREMNLLIDLYYDRRLRAIRRANARSGLRRLLDLWYTRSRAALAAALVERAYEPPAHRSRERGLAPGVPRL